MKNFFFGGGGGSLFFIYFICLVCLLFFVTVCMFWGHDAFRSRSLEGIFAVAK